MKVALLGYKPDSQAMPETWRVDCLQGLRQLGCDVTRLRIRPSNGAQIRQELGKADLLLWLRNRSMRYDDTAIRDTLRWAENRGVVTASLHLDLYWSVPHREPHIGECAWWTTQHVFTADGGERDWPAHVNHHWFPPPFGTRYLGLHPTRPRYAHDAVFVGSVIHDIHGPDRGNLVDWARRTYGPGFAHYGHIRGHRIWGKDLNALYASAGVVLGDSAPADRYWSDRVPRTLGRGGILAHPDTVGMDEQGFTDEMMIRYRRGHPEEAKQRRDSMTSAEVAAMRGAAVTLVAERHTWKHAMQRLLTTVGLW